MGVLIRNLQLLLLATLLSVALASHAEGLDLDRYRGKVVVVDFWASWCVPCRRSFPWLNDIQSKYGDRVVVIGVNVDRDQADAARFLRDVPATFPMIYDPEGKLAAHYEVPGMPSSFIFDAQGKLVARHIGFRSADAAAREQELRELLPAKANL